MTVSKELTETRFVDHMSGQVAPHFVSPAHKWRSFSTSRKNRKRYSLKQKFIIICFDVVKRTVSPASRTITQIASPRRLDSEKRNKGRESFFFLCAVGFTRRDGSYPQPLIGSTWSKLQLRNSGGGVNVCQNEFLY